jgi:ribosomal protein S18 acetylase RimI-like enzyme
MSMHFRLLGPDDAPVLARVAHDVFDNSVDPLYAAEFLADPRHHLAVALDGELVVGFASAVHYLHPDKPPELWVNEVGVAATHRRQGIARGLLELLFSHGQTLGCREAWVLTEPDNEPARRLYQQAAGAEARVVMYSFCLDAAVLEPAAPVIPPLG